MVPENCEKKGYKHLEWKCPSKLLLITIFDNALTKNEFEMIFCIYFVVTKEDKPNISTCKI